MAASWWFVAIVLAVVVWIVLEGRRQERLYGRSRRRGLMRTGLLELQKQLEPERRIEILLDERDDSVESEAAAPPDPDRPAGIRPR
ncbi:MAG: hypothetical protein AB7G12_04010 [Thermoanaerobaculia bacterium]